MLDDRAEPRKRETDRRRESEASRVSISLRFARIAP